jgi:hypothetical protein
MAIGLDMGTAILVLARKEDGKTEVKSERNCFIDMDMEFMDMIEKSEYKYIIDEENGEKKIYVVGKDAMILDNLYSSKDQNGNKTSRLRRPMASMVINSKTEKMAIKILKHMVQGLVGPPKYEGEIAVISVPSSSLDGSVNNTFHTGICESFVRELGYKVISINEALAVVYATNPTTEDNGEKINMTGIAISYGGGGVNICLAYKNKDIIRFSIPKSGDWIDKQVADVTQLSSSQVTIMKEKKSRDKSFTLLAPNYDDEVLSALYFFYKELIRTVVREFKAAFIKEKTSFESPIEVILSGGTSLPEGFDVMTREVIEEIKWPFEIRNVRKAQDPLSSTALGALMAAMSYEKKEGK